MTMEKCLSDMYILQKYQGRASRHTCPNCGRKRCFALYVNEDGKALAPMVGRCDHQSKCGYHYKPKEFFRDHPSLAVPESWRQPMPPVERKLWTIRTDEVRRFRSDDSTLLQYLKGVFGEEAVKAAANVYQLGALANGSTIFWQIDKQGRVHTGKVMAYGEDGHRIKTEGYDRVNWMHSLLKRDNLLPDEFDMTQCLFGEHLINLTDRPVAVVESEKTAVIMSMVLPAYTWVATGGKYNLTGDRMGALIGRRVYLYPDADAEPQWRDFAASVSRLYDIRVCDLHYTADDIDNKRDIADLTLLKITKQ